ncbi:hypothetical protein [Subdoligranulum variabile]|uniref:hypothetical protein n=1 Tax=Subdoligranulum variabile TaxID=214851 RepID=UPI0026F227BF|nr:hypothetical protein [Subdoligranulum variabile]
MRKEVTFYQIDGKPMLAPDAEPDFTFTDLDSSDSGRDESGVMHRIVVREKVGTWGFTYSRLTDAQYAYLVGLFAGKAQFSFTHPRVGSSTETEVSTCYCSNYSVAWRSARDGIWHNLKFNIIEC